MPRNFRGYLALDVFEFGIFFPMNGTGVLSEWCSMIYRSNLGNRCASLYACSVTLLSLPKSKACKSEAPDPFKSPPQSTNDMLLPCFMLLCFFQPHSGGAFRTHRPQPAAIFKQSNILSSGLHI